MKTTVGLLVKLRGNVALQRRFTKATAVADETQFEVEHHEKALLEAGYTVQRIAWGPGILEDLLSKRIDIAFNVSSLVEAALLEEEGIPYVGSDPFTIALATDKSLAKRLWTQEGLPTSRFVVARNLVDCDAFIQNPPLPFPLFLKPLAGRGSAGISPTSVARNFDELLLGVAERLESMGQPVLIERFLKGREITVGILGNHNPQALPPLEIVYRDGDVTLTFEKKDKDDDTFLCPAPLSVVETQQLQLLAIRAYQALGFRDFGRIDLILTEDGPFLLEGNTFAGLMCTPVDRPRSYMGFMARAAGMDSSQLIGKIVREALDRTRRR